MTSTSTGPTQRVGDSERQAAIALLGAHWRAGRLDPAEHEARTTRAFHAQTRGELDALFADLPVDPAAGVPQDAVAPGSAQPGAPVQAYGQGASGQGSTVPAPQPAQPSASAWDRRRGALLGAVPMVATLLFFVTGYHWQWFLLIPATYTLSGILSGEPSHGDGCGSSKHARREARRQRHLERGH